MLSKIFFFQISVYCFTTYLEEVNKENSNNSSIEMDKVDEHDKIIVAGLLETCVIIWEGINDELEKVRS